MMSTRQPVPVEPRQGGFERDVLAGLSAPHKRIGSEWLYDERGCELLDAVLRLPENYPAQAERWLLQQCADEIAALAGPRGRVVDIAALRSCRPGRRSGQGAGRCVVFVPCRSLAQLGQDEVRRWLREIHRRAGPGAVLVTGTDTTIDPARLLPASDDRAGANAALHLHLLRRINRELAGDFDLGAFCYQARHVAHQRRVEMLLVSQRPQQVRVAGRMFGFAAGEAIQVASLQQFGVLQFRALASRAGWQQQQLWMDGSSRVALHVFESSAPAAAGWVH